LIDSPSLLGCEIKAQGILEPVWPLPVGILSLSSSAEKDAAPGIISSTAPLSANLEQYARSGRCLTLGIMLKSERIPSTEFSISSWQHVGCLALT